MSFKDKTFCASPTCQNKCGRKMSDEEVAELKRLGLTATPGDGVWYAYFCDENGEPFDDE